ncbi:hypothetical protein BV22DRAFT_1123452 [Leucogyrophana mollusca]|uniref:Uncharacterized protein n=1 Tax=Leucogyrophana mollusca TaxID=85980 RepID=A0ACB8B0C2_9AGAM|nr:hypothetical protein BV22DRAFT_1123452 [Leucogyrophana mollusca]
MPPAENTGLHAGDISAGNPSEDAIASLKRTIAALQGENAKLKGEAEETPADPYHLEGRIMRRLVCLTARIEDLIGEADRRIALEADGDDEAETYSEVSARTAFSGGRLFLVGIHADSVRANAGTSGGKFDLPIMVLFALHP